MVVLAVGLLVGGLILVLVVLLARLGSRAHRRTQPRASITESQARKNTAPLSTAILASNRRERTSR
jgi:hypothetical protein